LKETIINDSTSAIRGEGGENSKRKKTRRPKANSEKGWRIGRWRWSRPTPKARATGRRKSKEKKHLRKEKKIHNRSGTVCEKHNHDSRKSNSTLLGGGEEERRKTGRGEEGRWRGKEKECASKKGDTANVREKVVPIRGTGELPPQTLETLSHLSRKSNQT